MNRDTQSRRQFLRAAVATTGGVALAGCSSSGESPTDESGDGSGGEEATEQGGDGGATGTSTVEMTDELTFEPETIEVSVGTEVTWENVGAVGHTVTAYEDEIPADAAYFASGGFDSLQAAKDGYSDGMGGNIPEGESYSHTFETAGTYEYYCIPHEMNGMVGTVEVV